ncbi:MAG TPA: cupredoxin domain-containing protein [Acidimicrobiales bacterium]|nr:cupredoxin domain-containing protein [Acidimicrobiales bacterium]
MDHPEWLEPISAAADGELDDAEAARLDAHLAACPSCRSVLAGFEADRRRARFSPTSAPARDDLAGAVLAARSADHRDADRARVVLLRRTTAAAVAVAAAVVALVLITAGTSPLAPVGPSQDHDALIAARDRSFDRADIEVEAGTTVEWRNAGSRTHHLVREFDGVTVGEDLPPGRTETATFDRPGTFAYFCTIHPEMVGTVTVDA